MSFAHSAGREGRLCWSGSSSPPTPLGIGPRRHERREVTRRERVLSRPTGAARAASEVAQSWLQAIECKRKIGGGAGDRCLCRAAWNFLLELSSRNFQVGRPSSPTLERIVVRSQSMVWSSVFSKERGGDLGLRPGSRKERAERRERERAEREREPYMTTLPHHRSHIAYSDHPRQHPLAISHGGWRGRASEASGRSRLQRSSATQVQERARERGLIYRAARWGGTRQQIADRRRSVGGAIGHCSVAQSRACGGVRAWFGLVARAPPARPLFLHARSLKRLVFRPASSFRTSNRPSPWRCRWTRRRRIASCATTTLRSWRLSPSTRGGWWRVGRHTRGETDRQRALTVGCIPLSGALRSPLSEIVHAIHIESGGHYALKILDKVRGLPARREDGRAHCNLLTRSRSLFVRRL